jgi:hypothetical protein
METSQWSARPPELSPLSREGRPSLRQLYVAVQQVNATALEALEQLSLAQRRRRDGGQGVRAARLEESPTDQRPGALAVLPA